MLTDYAGRRLKIGQGVVYIAAPDDKFREAEYVAIRLRLRKWSVASKWHVPEIRKHLADRTDLEKMNDVIQGITKATTVVFLAGEGCDFELGYALFLNKKLVVIGENRTRFQKLPLVEWFDSWEGAVGRFPEPDWLERRRMRLKERRKKRSKGFKRKLLGIGTLE